jgi:hypothetical protein
VDRVPNQPRRDAARLAAIGLVAVLVAAGTAITLVVHPRSPATTATDDAAVLLSPRPSADVPATVLSGGLSTPTDSIAPGSSPTPSAHGGPALPVIPTNPECASGFPARDAVGRADEIMSGSYPLPPFKAVRLGTDPTWAEDPLHDRYWRFRFHSLRWLSVLFEAWSQTGNAAYHDRAATLLRDWYEDDPVRRPPSPGSWEDHATAWRGMIYSCAARILPPSRWLTAALELHGRVLADPAFYIKHGNHALNQDRGLLAVGCTLGRDDWMRLAGQRLEALVTESVDEQGAINEQAPYYALLDYEWYMAARDQLVACRQPVPVGFARLARIPLFLAHATLPDNQYDMIGDTLRRRSIAIQGTPAEYAASQGTAGIAPATVEAIYDAGFAFVRTGWGEQRPFADEVHVTLRFGPARRFHGHDDAGSLTLYGDGSRLLLDAGAHTFKSPAELKWAAYFVSRAAHDVVTVDGIRYTPTASRLVWHRSTPEVFGAGVAVPGYAGVTLQRTVYFVRQLPYLVVDDVASSARAGTYRQRWHLAEDADPMVEPGTAITMRPRGNVLIRQAESNSQTDSRLADGWVSYEYGQHLPAPVVEFISAGKAVHFVTVIVPFATARPQVSAKVERVGGAATVEVTIDGHVDRLVLDGPEKGSLQPQG